MRPFGPVACTSASSTPNSRASMRTAGPAWTLVPSRLGAPTGGGASVFAGAAAGLASGAGASVAAGAEGAAAGAASPSASSSRISSPSFRVSPSFTLRALTTPAAGEGISMLALSDSSVSRLWSASMRSPTLTISSMISPWPLPMSGTRTVCMPPPLARGAGSGAAAGGALGSSAAGAGASAWVSVAPPSACSSRISSPSFRVSPTLTLMLFTTPALGAGISMLALSDSRVSRLCSASILSPTLTSNSMTSPWPLPMSGTRISSLTMLLLSSPGGCACSGRGRA